MIVVIRHQFYAKRIHIHCNDKTATQYVGGNARSMHEYTLLAPISPNNCVRFIGVMSVRKKTALLLSLDYPLFWSSESPDLINNDTLQH